MNWRLAFLHHTARATDGGCRIRARDVADDEPIDAGRIAANRARGRGALPGKLLSIADDMNRLRDGRRACERAPGQEFVGSCTRSLIASLPSVQALAERSARRTFRQESWQEWSMISSACALS